MSDKKHVNAISDLYMHPIAHNIKWVDLLPALASIGLVHAEKNGMYHFERNGHVAVFECSNRDTLNEDEIMKLRHFIYSSSVAVNKKSDLAGDVIVAIDYHQAHIFKNPGKDNEDHVIERNESLKDDILHAKPTAPPYSNVGPVINEDYFEAVIKDIKDAKRIVLLGHGGGSSNAAAQLMAQIRQKQPQIAHKIAAIERCDLGAMSEAQMIGRGKKLLGVSRPPIL